jgi:chromosome segregation ATPase
MADEETPVVAEESVKERHPEPAEGRVEGPAAGEEAAPAENAEVAGLQAALEEREARIASLERDFGALREEMAAALQKYRASLLASAPEVPEEMVQGDTVQQVEEAFARARSMAQRIRSDLEAQASRERVPAGAPARSAPDLSSLSAREKIAYGLAVPTRRDAP